MANTINTAGGSFADMSRFTELRQRLFFLIGALIVYRIGTYIPVPGIDPNALQSFFEEQSGTILSILNSAIYIVRVVGMTILSVLIVNSQLLNLLKSTTHGNPNLRCIRRRNLKNPSVSIFLSISVFCQ